MSKNDECLHLKGRGAEAQGKFVENGFLVLCGAKVAEDETKSCSVSVHNEREKYFADGTFSNGKLTRDLLFKGIARACAVLTGGIGDGRGYWRYENGESITERETREATEAREHTGDREPEETASLSDVRMIEEIINDMLPGLALYVRDLDLTSACAAAYHTGDFLMEPGFTDASNRVMGMATTHRIAILSNHMADLRDDGDAGKWGLFVANHHSHFKVLDVYKAQGKTQILLLHYPDGDSWKLFRDVEFNMEKDMIASCRARFENKLGKPVIPELASDDWRERCEKPVGMDEEGQLYDLDMEAGELPVEIRNLEYAIIMNTIMGGLVDDAEKDATYLQYKMRQYKNHPQGKEIIKECARQLYELIPDDKKKEFISAADQDRIKTAERIQDIHKLRAEGKLPEAKEQIEALVDEADQNPMFREDKVSQYFCFREWFEECLYEHLYHPKKEIRASQYPYASIYILQGMIAVETKDFVTARKALLKGLQWNPMNTAAAFEYAETFKMEGDMERFLEETKKIQKMCLHSRDIARFLRNVGFYFGETGQYEEAMMCVIRSVVYDRESKIAEQELVWLHEEHKVPLIKMDPQKCQAFEKRFGFPLGADNDLLRLLYAYGKHFMDDNEPAGARYCLEILYELTNDDNIRKMIDQLPKPQ